MLCEAIMVMTQLHKTGGTAQGYINQVERSEKKVGNNKLVAAFPDDAKVGQVPGGRTVVILFDGMRADFSIVEICY